VGCRKRHRLRLRAIYPGIYYLLAWPESSEMLKARPALTAFIERMSARESARNTATPLPNAAE